MDATAKLFDNWFDPIESGLRNQARSLIEAMIEGELSEVLSRARYGRQEREVEGATPVKGYRHGHRTRTLMGTFGATEITVPRARLETGG
jgi:transposase-like protein